MYWLYFKDCIDYCVKSRLWVELKVEVRVRIENIFDGRIEVEK